MAASTLSSEELVEKFQKFCSLAGSKDKTLMTSKASGKLVADCFEKDYKKFDVKSICDASVFPALKEKGKPHMIVKTVKDPKDDNVDKYLSKTAHEIAKRKTKNNKIAAVDPEVMTIKADLITCVTGGGPKVKEVKQSATGNVGGLTDTSHYTGAHKERFGADGKGKGLEGRADIADNSGYVGNYKGEDTYGK